MKFKTFTLILISFGLISVTTIWINNAVYAAVKITSPHKGQQIPLGSNIVITGTSSANATNHCTVLVILNGIKPYQQTIATGHGGSNDYSNWTFTATPKYAAIKEGQNKITAKFSCPTNLNLTKFYSVNVTGVEAGMKIKQPVQPTNNTSSTGTGFSMTIPGMPAASPNGTLTHKKPQ